MPMVSIGIRIRVLYGALKNNAQITWLRSKIKVVPCIANDLVRRLVALSAEQYNRSNGSTLPMYYAAHCDSFPNNRININRVSASSDHD